MKILYLSYGLYEYDGRMRELIKVSKLLGETKYITRLELIENKEENNHVGIKSSGKFGYFKFIIKCIMAALKMKKVDIIFADNRKAIIPAIIIRLLINPKYIIQDVRELYLINEVNYISGKIGCIFEQRLIKQADIVISASKYRSIIMKDYFELLNTPLVYENIRMLEYIENESIKYLNEKFGNYFNRDTIKIISTSGFSISRTNDVLVKALLELGENYELFLIGGGSKSDKDIIVNIKIENKLDNVHMIDKLNESELKYFIINSHIGIVNYNQKDTNNKYCASGKIYEFLFEGLPVVTTENIPLMEMCNDYKIGLSDNNYVEAIKEVSNNYEFYKKNVKKYIEGINVSENNISLVNSIKNILDLENEG